MRDYDRLHEMYRHLLDEIAPPCTDQGRAEPKSAELPLFYGADYINYLFFIIQDEVII